MRTPAARVGDIHTCPTVTLGSSPVRRVAGPVLPPGGVTALIGSRPVPQLRSSTAHGRIVADTAAIVRVSLPGRVQSPR